MHCTDSAAALCEPASVAVHAVQVSQLRLGDSAAVLGAGPIGLFTLDQAANMIRPRGQAVLIAVPWKPLPIEAADWMARHVNIQTTFGQYPDDWHTVLRLMQRGQMVVEPMIREGDVVPLEGIRDAFESLYKPQHRLQMIVRL